MLGENLANLLSGQRGKDSPFPPHTHPLPRSHGTLWLPVWKLRTQEIILVMPIKTEPRGLRGKCSWSQMTVSGTSRACFIFLLYFLFLTTVNELPTVTLNFTQSLLCSLARVCQIPKTTCRNFSVLVKPQLDFRSPGLCTHVPHYIPSFSFSNESSSIGGSALNLCLRNTYLRDRFSCPWPSPIKVM